MAVTFTHRGELTEAQLRSLEALSSEQVKIFTANISDGNIIGSVLSSLETGGIATNQIGYLVLGANMGDIMNTNKDVLGYNDWLRSAPERLKNNFQVLGIQDAKQGDLYSGPDVFYAALSVLFESFNIPSQYLKGLTSVRTPFGFSVWVLGPIVDKEIRTALFSKQVESAA